MASEQGDKVSAEIIRKADEIIDNYKGQVEQQKMSIDRLVKLVQHLERHIEHHHKAEPDCAWQEA